MAEMGITDVRLLPGYRGASGASSIGYDTYDLFDLGEFGDPARGRGYRLLTLFESRRTRDAYALALALVRAL